MIINADLHIHSHYSTATSDKMTIETLALEAPRKGIHILGTGDCLHPGWMKEVSACNKIDEGTFELHGTRFLLSAEVEGQRRVHHLLLFPSLSAVEIFRDRVKSYSKNIDTDGRAHLDLSGETIASYAQEVGALIGPCHAFSPYTSLYAHHDSLTDCYGNLTDYVSFLELGLSADSSYADTIDELHRLTYLTNSDCHSSHPVRLGREFTRFKVHDVTFSQIKNAILRQEGNKPVLNVGFFPQEGKYNESACMNCKTHYTLEEATRRRWKCSCGKKIIKGVKDRVAEHASSAEPKPPRHRPPYTYLIPLSEIIVKAVGQRSPFTKTVTTRWEELVSTFGTEITVLLDSDLDDIARITTPPIVDAIRAFRESRIDIIPGGGGVYGQLVLPTQDKILTVSLGPSDHQTSLLEYDKET